MKAVVIGAGIGGLTAAIALRRSGVATEVFERADELTGVGAGISLWANAMCCLTELGIGEALLGGSVAYDAAGLRTPDGRVLGSVSVDYLKRRFPVPIVVLHRAELMTILRAAYGPANLHLGETLVRVEQDVKGVRAEFADEAARIPRSTMFVRRSWQVCRIAQLEHPAAVAIRNAVFRRIPPRVQTARLAAMIDG